MKQNYEFLPALIVRTPALPFDSHYTEASLRQRVQEARFAEALFLASPDLHRESQKLHEPAGAGTDARKTARLYSSLGRYYGRMSSRCTPFALFAGCGVAQWGAHSRIVRDAAPERRHTRLDMHYLCALARQLGAHPVLRERLHYTLNSTLYRIGDELRYVEHPASAEHTEHQISSVAASEPLLLVLRASRPGATRAALAQLLVGEEVTPDEALAFVDELVDAQLLVSELEPVVTGVEYMRHVRAVLERLHARQPAAELRAMAGLLQEVEHRLAALDAAPEPNPSAAYEHIGQLLQALGAPLEANKLFQTDLSYTLPDATLAASWQDDLLEALQVLQCLVRPAPSRRLVEFQRQFYARYEEQEVPLLEALDSESGIGYTDYGRNSYSSLIQGLRVGDAAGQQQAIRPDDVQHFLYEKLRAADRNGDYTVTLTPGELQPFRAAAQAELPPSISVVFRVVDEQQLVLEGVSGSSAANLLGRFAYADEAIGEVLGQIAEAEQARNPGLQFAEICHLPTGRVGNILQRPSFRALEIPYLAQSLLPAEQQLPAHDLYLSVRQGRLVLRSKRLNQVIVPRLGTAHNYTNQALPVYQFLCDLQSQGLTTSLNFSWDSVAHYHQFQPRLTYGRVVLRPAVWQLIAADLQPLLQAAEPLAAFAAFRERWRLPARFTLADGDNELLVDAANPFTVQVWLDVLRGRESVRLKEYLFEEARTPVVDTAGRGYAHQFVATLLRRTPAYPALAGPAPGSAAVVQREFTLGSEWLYAKLYCGPKVADRVLVEAVKPLTESLLADGLIDRWFFVRYADPDAHLRVRLHLPDVARIGEVVQRLSEVVTPLVRGGYVWKTQTDTYRRELERYGADTIEQAEALFGADSVHAVQLLEQTYGLPGADDVYWLGGLRFVDELLEAFGYEVADKARLLKRLQEAFAREFNADKALKLQLDQKYREHRPAIERVLQATAPAAMGLPVELPSYHHGPVVRAVAQELRARQGAGQLSPGLDQLLSSYIHMLLNRLISAQPRLHELVIYDFLARQYRAQLARSGAAISAQP